MMAGIAIRMAQALGLQREGAHFKHLAPYEIEMRRRAWWALCLIDVRASEDQGTDYTIAYGSFDTKLPLNLNDADFGPETTEMPPAREGLTDMTLPLVSYETCDLTKEMMTRSVKDGASSMEEQDCLLGEIYAKLGRGYLRYSVESGNIAYWTTVVSTRLVMAKMTLLIYLPILSPIHGHSRKAVRCRHRDRGVNPCAERGAGLPSLVLDLSDLHPLWSIPAQSHMDKNLWVCIPLRKLMAKARKHRDVEIERL
ncbi:hypothetical protein N8T08_009647 [Aspergillus melleus]|uniref:Uncharacterized protein n=1 Tax=Aspergillus melleus TaxID=138277 RepID=A0ACC3ATL3_9EURO|nr:hypothetical protein N8T08_009647 [Aspergillus melleus]